MTAAAAAVRLHLHPHLRRTPRAATLRTPVHVRTATSASAPFAITAAPATTARASAPGRVLLLGEGDFSFAHALMRSSDGLELTATSLNSAEEAVENWGAAPHLQALQSFPTVTVQHRVDATRLHCSALAQPPRFQCVAFLFPHSGRKGMHHLNTQLLHDFVASAAPLLTEDGRMEVTLAPGQGGTPADGAHLRPQPADSWQVQEAAAAAGLLLTAAVPFQKHAWAQLGYTQRGCWRGYTQGFHADDGALVHVLQPPDGCSRSAYPAHYERDVTVWADHWGAADSHSPDGGDEAAAAQLDRTLLSLLQTEAACNLFIQRAWVVEVWRRPADGRCSVHLRVRYGSSTLPLGAAKVAQLHEQLRAAVPTLLGMPLRTRQDALSVHTQ